VEKTRKRKHGRDLVVVVAALVERYMKLGLDRKVPEAIRTQVFGVVAPMAQ
jgi:hypothetical protein